MLINSTLSTMLMSMMMRMSLCFQDSFKLLKTQLPFLNSRGLKIKFHLCYLTHLRIKYLTPQTRLIRKTWTLLKPQLALRKGGQKQPVVNQSKRLLLWTKSSSTKTTWSRFSNLIRHKRNYLVSHRFSHMHQPLSRRKCQQTKFRNNDDKAYLKTNY